MFKRRSEPETKAEPGHPLDLKSMVPAALAGRRECTAYDMERLGLPTDLAHFYFIRTLTQYDCKSCCLEVRHWQLEGHRRWHEALLARLDACR